MTDCTTIQLTTHTGDLKIRKFADLDKARIQWEKLSTRKTPILGALLLDKNGNILDERRR